MIHQAPNCGMNLHYVFSVFRPSPPILPLGRKSLFFFIDFFFSEYFSVKKIKMRFFGFENPKK